MKNIIKIIGMAFLCGSVVVTAQQVPQECVERMQEIEKGCYDAIDDMFARVRVAAVNNEDMSDPEWVRHPDINGLQNLLADVRIEYSFDPCILKPISEKIDTYFQKKLREEMAIVVNQDVDITGVRMFLAVAKILCELNEGADCNGLIRAVKNENRHIIHALKEEKIAQLMAAQLDAGEKRIDGEIVRGVRGVAHAGKGAKK